jgi:hypothetical protein
MWKDLLERQIALLRQAPGELKLRTFEIGRGIEEPLLEQTLAEADVSLSPDLLQLYREMNGAEASWSWYPKGEEIFGSIWILPLQKALFGFTGRIERSRYEEAWVDELWNRAAFAEESIRELKGHRVFEPLEGEPGFVTFKPSLDATNLLYVYEEEISTMRVSFTEYLRLVLEHLGAGRIREYLASDDWEERIRTDATLRTVQDLMAMSRSPH